jgi:pimeloyl-ACP methyl ester carboxylesterase
MRMRLPVCAVLTFVTTFTFVPGVFALNYSGSQGNKATFETLEETRASSPAAVANLETNAGRTFKSHPVLDGYPAGTTFVYRSANLFGGRAAARLNTDILVFTDKSFQSKDAALAYLKDLGLTAIVDQAIGSVILVTPADPKAGFGASDQKNYYALQTAMLAQKASETNGKVSTSYSDAEYFGGYGYTYVVGIDGGATFLNNYVAGTLDYVGRIAGMLLINGKMDAIRQVAALVPAYLVNASDAIVEKYKRADSVDSYAKEGALETFYNKTFPLRKVVATKDPKPDAARYIKDAYFNMFIKAMRVPVLDRGLYTAGTPYQGYGFDEAPYSLCERNAVIDGVTRDGIHLNRRTDERFSDVKTAAGEYLQTWFEYLPEEVLNGTAPKGSVPLFLANHGGGDDPRVFVDEIGLLALAGSERFAIVAPEEQSLWVPEKNDPTMEMCSEMMPKLVRYMLSTYPSLDPSRVYVTGYSMGGGATLKTINGDPGLFAGSVVMAASSYVATPKQAAVFSKIDLPVMLLTSTYDNPAVGAFDLANGTIAEGFQKQIKLFVGYNGLNTINTFDFAAYPIVGFNADKLVIETVNDEYTNHRWYLNNSDGVPMVAVSYTEGLVHALYPEYGKIDWNFLKHYSRDQKTGAIKYNPYVK